MEKTISQFARAFRTGFIAETPEKLRRLPKYFAAAVGKCDFPTPRCNAPWVSAVIEASGAVRPCFFHATLGNLHDDPLAAIVNSAEALAFRENLDVKRNPVCRRCTCSLYLNPWDVRTALHSRWYHANSVG